MLRVERKRDGLVKQLTDLGWPPRQAKAALEKEGWDVDAATTRLTSKKK